MNMDYQADFFAAENPCIIFDAFGRTYLMHAARLGFLPAVDLLIGRGIDVNAMDNDGFTALSIAYRHKKELIVQYLLKNGAKTWIEKPYKPEDQSLIKELENRWK
jgi:ankyrin repeat protein